MNRILLALTLLIPLATVTSVQAKELRLWEPEAFKAVKKQSWFGQLTYISIDFLKINEDTTQQLKLLKSAAGKWMVFNTCTVNAREVFNRSLEQTFQSTRCVPYVKHNLMRIETFEAGIKQLGDQVVGRKVVGRSTESDLIYVAGSIVPAVPATVATGLLVLFDGWLVPGALAGMYQIDGVIALNIGASIVKLAADTHPLTVTKGNLNGIDSIVQQPGKVQSMGLGSRETYNEFYDGFTLFLESIRSKNK